MDKILSKRSLFVVMCFCAGVVSVCNATGSITGTVSNTSSGNISGASVMVFREGASVDQDQTDSTGTYLISDLEANTYEIHVKVDGYELRIESGIVVVDDNETTKNVTNLAAEGLISGKVTLSDDTTGVSGTLISAKLTSGSGPTLFAISDSLGDYTITNLPAGSYSVKAYDSDHSFNEVVQATVSSGSTTSDVDFSETDWGIIAGTVSIASSGINDALVYAFQPSNPTISDSAITDPNGDYSITKLPVGTYTVQTRLSGYQFEDSTDNTVTSGQTTSGVDFTATASPTGKIAGEVTESDGSTPIVGAYVTAIDSSDSNNIAVEETDINGEYEISGLTTGTYEVTAQNAEGLIAEDDNVSVTNGSTTTLDLSSVDGAISGTITNSSQSPVEGATVIVLTTTKSYMATSDANGDYVLESLPAGDYDVKVFSGGNYISDVIEGITVQANTETAGQDFTLLTGGTISGTVSDTTGGISGAVVTAVSETDPNYFASTLTDSSGDYSVGGFPTGTYTLIVQADSYVSDSETNISVTSGEDSADHDFTLGTTGGSISGTVYESDETTAIEGALVSCYCEGKSIGTTTTDSNGDYSLSLLQPGTYEVNAFAVGFQLEILTDVIVTGTQENSDNIFTLDAQ